MRSSIHVDVGAPPELVFQLAHDPTRWPSLLPHYVRARCRATDADGRRLVEFVALRPLVAVLGIGVPVAWRSLTWSDPVTRSLRFVHRGGATDGMDVSWTIVATPDGCRVTIEHVFRQPFPVPWLRSRLGPDAFPRFVDRWVTGAVAGRTLATFKAVAEALAAERRAATEPDGSPGTNMQA